MSKVKINFNEYVEVEENIVKAITSMERIEESWNQNFANLNQNFIESGFLEDLYKDAESQYYHLANAGYFVSYVAGMAGTGAAAGAAAGAISGTVVPVVGNLTLGAIGGIAGAVIGFFLGIYHCVKNPNNVKWCYDSKIIFEELLKRCYNWEHDNYTSTENIHIKLENVSLSLIELKTKINEFQKELANLQDAADKASLGDQLNVSKEGIVLGVETEVNIGGETVKMSISEAMNAFYTYDNAVMSAEFEADYMKRTYGIDVDYDNLVSHANSFMTDTIKSGLYTHEFIDVLLPGYTADYNTTVNGVAGNLGIATDAFNSILDNNQNSLGDLAKAGGLVGAAFLGNLVSNPGSGGSNGGSSGSGSGTGGGGSSSSNPGSGGQNPDNSATTPAPKPTDEDKEQEEEKKPEEKIENDVEIEKVSDEELPDEVKAEIEKDYDDLARAEYEKQGSEALEKHRAEILDRINESITNGDYDSLRKELKEYGYSDSDIETIMKDRDSIVTAIVAAEEKQALKEIAEKLAKEDKVENFKSEYSDSLTAQDIKDGTTSGILVNASADKDVAAARDTLNNATENYEKAVSDANKSLKEVTTSETKMKEIYDKYSKEYGSDTKNWTEEAAKEYNESIKNYNESVDKAKNSVEKSNAAKEEYNKSKENYDKTKNEFLSKIKEQNDLTNSSNSGPISELGPSEETIIFDDQDALGTIDISDGTIGIK